MIDGIGSAGDDVNLDALGSEVALEPPTLWAVIDDLGPVGRRLEGSLLKVGLLLGALSANGGDADKEQKALRSSQGNGDSDKVELAENWTVGEKSLGIAVDQLRFQSRARVSRSLVNYVSRPSDTNASSWYYAETSRFDLAEWAESGFHGAWGLDPARGFSTCPAGGPISVGSPEQYAAGKAKLFPNEGGPAIVEIEIPDDLAELGIDAGGEIRFEPGFGLEALLEAWPTITKRVV